MQKANYWKPGSMDEWLLISMPFSKKIFQVSYIVNFSLKLRSKIRKKLVIKEDYMEALKLNVTFQILRLETMKCFPLANLENLQIMQPGIIRRLADFLGKNSKFSFAFQN